MAPADHTELSAHLFLAANESKTEHPTKIPQTEMTKAAFDLATTNLHPTILNHSVRVWFWAQAIAIHNTGSQYVQFPGRRDLLFVACILHDVGTSTKFNTTQRFEVDGADAAARVIREYTGNETDAQQVWLAVALHTSAGIAERASELCLLVRQAVMADFGKDVGVKAFVETKTELEKRFARNNISKTLGDCVVEQAKAKPEKAPPATWPGQLYRAYKSDPTWQGVNKAF